MDKLQFETVLQLAEEEMPKEVGLPLVVPGALKAMRPGAEALLCPGDKGTLSVNMGQQPFKLQPPASRPRPFEACVLKWRGQAVPAFGRAHGVAKTVAGAWEQMLFGLAFLVVRSRSRTTWRRGRSMPLGSREVSISARNL